MDFRRSCHERIVRVLPHFRMYDNNALHPRMTARQKLCKHNGGKQLCHLARNIIRTKYVLVYNAHIPADSVTGQLGHGKFPDGLLICLIILRQLFLVFYDIGKKIRLAGRIEMVFILKV